MIDSSLSISHPDWLDQVVDATRRYPDDESRIRLAIGLARANVEHDTGGPFGAAVVEAESGRLVAVGVNAVVRLKNSVLHAEMMAFMMAERALGSYTLRAPGMPEHALYSSCEPCAMCLGGALWSGVSRVVYAATREDARRLSFEEGPVFPESYAYVSQRGLEIVAGPCRQEAVAVFDLYRERGGAIYNG